jgi:exodeoxyribonuclease VIII
MNITFEQYRAMPGINASLLKACLNGAFSGYKALNEKVEESDAMRFGTALHTAILEPHKFQETVAVRPQVDRRTKEGKAIAEAFDSQNQGKVIISQGDSEVIAKITASVADIPLASKMLLDYEAEYTIRHETNGLTMKGRLDLVSIEDNSILDVKTTKSASPREFSADCIRFGYDVQLLHYAMLLGSLTKLEQFPRIHILACENNTGEAVLYDVTDMVNSDTTMARYQRALDTAKEVLQMKELPRKFPTEPVVLTAPKWAE